MLPVEKFFVSFELLMAVHVVQLQQIDICFKRKTDVSYVESKQTWCAKPATSEQPRSVFLRRKRCTWWGFSRFPHITGPHFPHHGIIWYAYEPQEASAYPRNHGVHVRATRATRLDYLETSCSASGGIRNARHKKRDNCQWNGEKLALQTRPFADIDETSQHSYVYYP